ncbi:MAG: hypothetical protein WBZ36_06485, partial [Candidatus Nitrosopolaris sp.]
MGFSSILLAVVVKHSRYTLASREQHDARPNLFGYDVSITIDIYSFIGFCIERISQSICERSIHVIRRHAYIANQYFYPYSAFPIRYNRMKPDRNRPCP